MYWNTWKRWKEFAPGWPVCYPLVHKVIKAFQLRPTNGLMESHHIMLLQRWAVSIYFTCFNTCYLRDINFTKCSGKWFVASYNLCVWKLASTLLGLTVWQGISLDHGLVWDSFCPLAVEWITQCSQVPILGTQWLIVSIYPKSFCTNSDINFTMVLGVLSWSFLKLEWVRLSFTPTGHMMWWDFIGPLVGQRWKAFITNKSSGQHSGLPHAGPGFKSSAPNSGVSI